jgi:hypothetical protein
MLNKKGTGSLTVAVRKECDRTATVREPVPGTFFSSGRTAPAFANQRARTGGMGQGSVGHAGQLIEELLGFGEFPGIKQSNRAREDTEIAGALGAIRAIGLVASGCFLHQYVGETVSDSPGWAQLSRLTTRARLERKPSRDRQGALPGTQNWRQSRHRLPYGRGSVTPSKDSTFMWRTTSRHSSA